MPITRAVRHDSSKLLRVILVNVNWTFGISIFAGGREALTSDGLSGPWALSTDYLAASVVLYTRIAARDSTVETELATFRVTIDML